MFQRILKLSDHDLQDTLKMLRILGNTNQQLHTLVQCSLHGHTTIFKQGGLCSVLILIASNNASAQNSLLALKINYFY